MSNHWQKSAIPYFPVIQDTSEVRIQSFSAPKRLSQGSSMANPDNSQLFNAPLNSYPEIRYIFKDDQEYRDLESTLNEEEEAIVIELDEKGEHIVKYSSLSPELQVLNVSIKDKNSTKTLEISTTRSELKGLEVIRPDKRLEHIKNLVGLFNLRNSQLNMITN